MAFHDVRFPDDISYGSAGGPSYRTDVVELNSGAEERNSRWSQARHRYDVSYGVRSYETLMELKKFFMARRGNANGFRFKDFLDFTTAANGVDAYSGADVSLGTGDGNTVSFQLKKYYSNGGIVRTRNIVKVVENEIIVQLDNVDVDPADYTVNSEGVLTFNDPPALNVLITFGCEFDVPVRFNVQSDEWLRVNHDSYGDGSATGIELIELINEFGASEEVYMGGATVLNPMSANYTLGFGDSRVFYCNPNASGRKLVLPDPSDAVEGGPYFVVINRSTTQSFTVNYPSGTAIATIAPSVSQNGGSGRAFFVSDDGTGTKVWIYA